jgi:hypothetical protein
VSISHTGRMREGLRYEVKGMIAGGKVTASEIEVVRLIPNQEIEVVNYAGLVAYRGMYRLVPRGPHETEVICTLKFEFQNYVLDLARPVIEAMAGARLRGNLEALRAILCGPSAGSKPGS